MTTDKMCKVKDLHAREKPRTHDLADTEGTLHPVEFPPGKHVELPMSLALRLVGNTGFEVIGPDGRVLKPLRPRNPELLSLAYDETVARYSELTVEALLDRARALNGGDKLTRKDGKDVIINFILEGGLRTDESTVQVGGNWLERPSGQERPNAA